LPDTGCCGSPPSAVAIRPCHQVAAADDQ
jgi:hypothetical protein